MKKYLLFIISMVCAVTGTWAYDDITMQLHTPSDAGDLKLYYFYEPDYPQIKATGVTMSSNDLVSDKSYGKVKITGTISSSNIEALNEIDAMILDLSEATLDGITSISNTNVKFLVLPNGSTRENLVNATALAGCTNLLTAIESHNDNGEISITAYVHVAGTLQPAMAAAGLATTVSENFKINGQTAYYPNLNNNDGTLTYATLSGNLIAYDICNMKQKVDNNGHFEWDSAASETVYDLVDPRKLVGTEVYGGLSGTQQLKELDMRDCYFSQSGDMTLSAQGANIAGKDLWKVVIPTDKRVTETPAWFTCTNGIKEICIPSNIKVIRTHFAQSVDHIWTTAATGDKSGTVYDNGCFTKAEDDPIANESLRGYTKLTFTGLYPCGTYTFSSNLELIETNAFYNTTPHVKDVYCLAVNAPECHVDAFNTAMYVASGGYNPTIVDGVITRDSYVNGSSWIAMLHYPRECKTPNVQRYTDPTRQYTTASNEVDGKGGVLYYPNFSEFLAAYAQGTTGYLWNGWSREYQYGALKESLTIGGEHWSAAIQKQANDTYLKNTDKTNPSYTAFYDVTANGLYSQPTGLVEYSKVYWDERTLSQSGTENQHLYPAAETSEVYYNYIDANITTSEAFEAFSGTLYTKNGTSYETASSFAENTTYYKRKQTQQTNSNGELVYDPCTGGDYVAEDTYLQDANGGYVRSAEAIEGSFTAVTKEQEYVDTYYTDNAGTKEVATPKVKNDTYWYENGTKPVFSEYGTYQPISGVTQYYTRTGNSEPFTYTEVNPTLNTTYYYKTGGETNTYSAGTYWPIEGQDTYYKLEGGEYTQEMPVLSNSSNGDWYYNTGNTQPTNIFSPVWKAQENVFVYYTSSNHETPVLPTFDGTYYYKNGTVNVYDYTFIGYYVNPTAGTQYYVKENNEYVAVNPKIHPGFYTYDSENKSYVEATTWQSGVTYYKNNNGVYDEASYSEIFIDGEYYTRSADTHEEDVYESTSQWIQDVNTYYSLNNTTYTSVLPGFNGSYDYISSTEDRPIYQKTTVFVPGIYNYYHTSDGITYYNNNEAPFSKEYFYVTGKTDEYLPTTTYTPGETYYNNINGTYTETTVQFNSQDYYYADGTTTRFDSANGEDWKAHEYFTDANGVNPAETIQFDGTYYIQDYDYTYTAYNAETDKGKDRWTKKTVYVAAETAGTGNYCPKMVDKEYRDITESHDYRGWHQFVLNAYAANTNEPVVPVRSYITDSDWWTICLPYNLTKKEVMLFYGDITANENGAVTTSDAVPQLCVLSNVVRDESRRHITLNFSDNLMTKKFQKNETTKIWEPVTGDGAGAPGDDDVVLHAGVPYLIKPVFKANANRQFDVYGDNNVNTDLSAGRIAVTEANYPGLNAKLAAAQEISGIPFREMQEKNIYTVPALLPADDEGNYTGTEEAYTFSEEPFTIGTKKYVRSKAFDYTFVGSLAKAVIPPFSYFLGYTTKACFIYADYTTEAFEQNKNANTPDYKNVMLWNNNSCIICPNMLSSSATNAGYYSLGKGTHDGLITPASNKQAAQWKIYGESVTPILSDDLYHSSSVASQPAMAMMFGMDMMMIGANGEATPIERVNGVDVKTISSRVYSLSGQYVGDSLEGLEKGIYIQNGKKVMVK